MPLKPLYYTFGNHMHWVDMQWLWGYDVLPGCVADMRNLIEHTGARGCVNFDGIGYEKMAAECPESLAELRAMIEAGQVEPVGCSYGQPYGLFQPGESNVRQFTYGVRSTRRLLGVRPQTFWEEEFYFFPQLPQVLRRCGYTGANLFFQWTWHTPELPKENASLILWEGIDGSRLPALPRNTLNVHQWPEDFDGLLEQGLINDLERPAIVQWLELMPSKDWMCRSEVLLPRLKELMGDKRFDVRPRTSAQLIAELIEAHEGGSVSPGREGGIPADPWPTGRGRWDALASRVPVRYYAPDDVWHGMTLGKNADLHPRTCRRVERQILAAESISALAGLLGRPYASWDVYPTWEIDEAWRELLAAQHHDNHECEGLCGFVGYQQMAKAETAAIEVYLRTMKSLELRSNGPVHCNALGWKRSKYVAGYDEAGFLEMPPFGVRAGGRLARAANPSICERGDILTLSRGRLSVEINQVTGEIVQIRSPEHKDGLLAQPIGPPRMIVNGREWRAGSSVRVEKDADMGGVYVQFDNADDADGEVEQALDRASIAFSISVPPSADAIEIAIVGIENLPRPDGGLSASLRLPIVPQFSLASIRTDSAFAAHAVAGGGPVCRKYPKGDWMTSPQWFDHFSGAIHSSSFIDFLDDRGRGFLVLHDSTQQWFRTEAGVDAVLLAYDPWDERRYEPDDQLCLRIVPHAGMKDSARARLAAEFLDDTTEWWNTHPGPVGGGGTPEGHPIPPTFAPMDIAGDDNILCHALYRDSMKCGEHLPDWAGHEMARRSGGQCTHPYVVRLVEWDGQPGTAILKFPGEVASVAKTNLMGEVGPQVGGGEDTGWLEPQPCEPPEWARGLESAGGWNQVRVPVRPREIATVMLDLVLGRKQWRDLDAKRKVWATIHRKDEPKQ